jgi:hypothetical protein
MFAARFLLPQLLHRFQWAACFEIAGALHGKRGDAARYTAGDFAVNF